MLCSWERHFTLTVPPSTQEYKWVPANCWGNLTSCWGVTCDGLASRPGGVEILLAASCYGNQDKLCPDQPVLAPKASLFTAKNKNYAKKNYATNEMRNTTSSKLIIQKRQKNCDTFTVSFLDAGITAEFKNRSAEKSIMQNLKRHYRLGFDLTCQLINQNHVLMITSLCY